jgi:acetylglutamate kinase
MGAMQKLFVIKIGGNIIDDPAKLSQFLKQFTEVEGYKILVHGGGKIATQIGEKLGLAPQYIDGRRITDEATIDLVTMVYGGLINKNAIGLTGADGNIIPATKRLPKPIDFGWVGDLLAEKVNTHGVNGLIQAGFTLVVAPLTHDGKGNMLNTNADTIASTLAVALSKDWETQLVYCFEKKGVLLDVDDENSMIPLIDRERFEALKTSGKLFSGMLPKLENALHAIKKGVSKVIIGHADDIKSNTFEIPTGTTIM